MKRIKLTEDDLHNIVTKSVKRILKEDFENDYNSAMRKHMDNGRMWGIEMKNGDNEWEYGEITFDPNTNQMSCMGVSIDVDPDMSLDYNIQGLYDALLERGYHDDDDDF